MRELLFQELFGDADGKPGLTRTNAAVVAMILLSIVLAAIQTEPELPAVIQEWSGHLLTFLSLVFALEYAARIYAAGELPQYAGWRGRLRFALGMWMLIDLLAIAPVFLGISDQTVLIRLVRIVRIIRLARIGQLSEATEALAAAISTRRLELVLSFGLALTVLLVSATLMFLVEGQYQPEKLGSIPRALWWAVVTLTTVGYGDVVPVTWLGKIIAGITAIVSVGLVALPAGIFASAFSDAFQAQRLQRRAARITDPRPRNDPAE